jgi:hypothetical protein
MFYNEGGKSLPRNPKQQMTLYSKGTINTVFPVQLSYLCLKKRSKFELKCVKIRASE